MKAAMGKAPAGDRIIGGSNAAGVVPWQVSLRNVHSGLDADMKPFEMSEHYCGGTILDAKTILSAAHCFPKGDEGVEGKQIMAVTAISPIISEGHIEGFASHQHILST